MVVKLAGCAFRSVEASRATQEAQLAKRLVSHILSKVIAGHDSSPTGGRLKEADAVSENRLLIVSNRLPVTVHRKGSIVELHDSVGGLATGLRGPHAHSNGWW